MTNNKTPQEVSEVIEAYESFNMSTNEISRTIEKVIYGKIILEDVNTLLKFYELLLEKMKLDQKDYY